MHARPRRLGTERFVNPYSNIQTVSFQVVMIGASDLDGYESTVVTLALLFGKRVDVIVLCGVGWRSRRNCYA